MEQAAGECRARRQLLMAWQVVVVFKDGTFRDSLDPARISCESEDAAIALAGAIAQGGYVDHRDRTAWPAHQLHRVYWTELKEIAVA